MPRILLVEDEKSVASFIRRGLKEEGFVVDVAADGEQALLISQDHTHDLMILDLMLPKKNGLEVLQSLRNSKNFVPVIMLTAKGGVDDKVKGLSAGADDYLSKPFEFKELLARAKALLRRPRQQENQIIKISNLTIDLLKQKVSRNGKAISLTAREFGLLVFLATHPDQVVTRTMLAEGLWDLHFDTFSNVIDVQIARLRKKIDQGFKPQLITTVRGKGYQLVTPHA